MLPFGDVIMQWVIYKYDWAYNVIKASKLRITTGPLWGESISKRSNPLSNGQYIPLTNKSFYVVYPWE